MGKYATLFLLWDEINPCLTLFLLPLFTLSLLLASTLLLPLLLHNFPFMAFWFPSFPPLPADVPYRAVTASVTSVGSMPHTVVPTDVRWQPADRRRVFSMVRPSTGRPSRQKDLLVPPQVVMALDTPMEVSSHTAGKPHADRGVGCEIFFLYTVKW